LLVSHWEVGSDAAVKLTTQAFAELNANPRSGRAEAMRLSMRHLIQNGSLAEAKLPTNAKRARAPKREAAPEWRREVWQR
jgi:hypothetical protein